jgi:hypothetical protein
MSPRAFTIPPTAHRDQDPADRPTRSAVAVAAQYSAQPVLRSLRLAIATLATLAVTAPAAVAAASPSAAVRKVLTEFVAAAYTNNGRLGCAQLAKAEQTNTAAQAPAGTCAAGFVAAFGHVHGGTLARAKTAIAHATFTPRGASATVIFNAPSVTQVLSGNTQGALDFHLARTHGHWLITELLS